MQNASFWRATSSGCLLPLYVALMAGVIQSAYANDYAVPSAGSTRIANVVATTYQATGFHRVHDAPVLDITYPGATFLRLHFATADIGDDAQMLIANDDGSEIHRVTRADILRDSGKDGYYAMSVRGAG